MSDTEETKQKLLNLQKAIRMLEKQGLQDTEAYNKLVSQQIEYKKKLKKESNVLLSNLKDSVKVSTNLRDVLKDTAESFKQVGSVFVSFKLLTNMTEMLKKNKELSIELNRSLVNSGRFGESLEEAKKATFGLRTAFGATFEDAKAVVETLAQKQYVGNIQEAAGASYQFARATGLGKAEVAQLTVDLQKIGKVSGKTTTAMYADLLKIQQANGMTKEGMKLTGDQIVKNAANMRAWGKTEAEIRNMAAKTGMLVSAFEKVGISAQEATSLIDKLLNPENIEENIASYAALGISLTDAINGEIDEGQISAGLKDFGNKLKEMGPIAGKAYAKAMGISYSQAIKATDLENATSEALTPTDQANEALTQLTENTKTWEEKLGDVGNKIEGFIQGLPTIILASIAIIQPIIGGMIERTMKNTKKKVLTETNDIDAKLEKIFLKNSLKLRELYKIGIDDISEYMSNTTLDQKDDLDKLGVAFAKMQKSSKGKDWLANNSDSLEMMRKAFKEKKAFAERDEQDARRSLAIAEKRLEQERMINSNEKEHLDKIKNIEAEQRAWKKVISESVAEQDKYQSKLNATEGISKLLKENLEQINNTSANTKISIDSGTFVKGTGDKFNGAAERILKVAKGTTDSMNKISSTATKTVGKVGGKFSAMINKVGNSTKKMADTISSTAKKAIDSIGKSSKGGILSKVGGKIGDSVGGSAGSIAKILSKLGWVGAVLGAVAAVIGIIAGALKKSEKFQQVMQKIGTTINNIFQNAIEPIINAIDFDAIAKAVASIAKIMAIVLIPMLKPVVAAINFIAGLVNKIVDGLKWLFRGLEGKMNSISDSSKETAENTSNDSPTTIVNETGRGGVFRNVSNGEASNSSSVSIQQTKSEEVGTKSSSTSSKNTTTITQSNAEVVRAINELNERLSSYFGAGSRGNTLGAVLRSSLDGISLNIEGQTATVNTSCSGGYSFGEATGALNDR